MKFFLSSETSLLTDDQAKELREARLAVNELMQKLVAESDYGSGVELLTVVHSLFPESYYEKNPESVDTAKFFESNKEAEARLKIDFDEFFKADMQQKQNLILQNILDSINAVKSKTPEGFDAEKLIQDVQNFMH